MSLRLKEIALETMDIIHKGKYMIDDKTVKLDLLRDREVNVNEPDKIYKKIAGHEQGQIIISADDSLVAAEKIVKTGEPCAVLNFASAKNPGGGFVSGANAQEERIARASTLICSIGGEKANEMYNFNRFSHDPFYSDYILYSPHVTVFRDLQERLIDTPFKISVITSPAVNRSICSDLLTDEAVDAKMIERVRKLLLTAYENGAKNLILGAWGCGVFRNRASDVARYFHTVLVKEDYRSLFKMIVFAIYEPSGTTEKLEEFYRVYNNEI